MHEINGRDISPPINITSAYDTETRGKQQSIKLHKKNSRKKYTYNI